MFLKQVKLRVENLQRFEAWLSERTRQGKETGRLRHDSSEAEKHEYLVLRAIDAEAKIENLMRDLVRMQKVVSSLTEANESLTQQRNDLDILVQKKNKELGEAERDRWRLGR